MFSLSPSHGPFPVGALTLVAPVRPPLAVGDAVLAGTTTAALVLDEVAFTAYYPADPAPSARRGVDWLVRPTSAALRGFSRFTGVSTWLLWPFIYFFGTMLKIPLYPNAPLLRPGDAQKQWPLVIFSHGLCGSRTAYSQVCSELAASGRVVLAAEHRDGTAPNAHGGKVLYYRDDDVMFPPDAPDAPGALPLRVDQLVFRQHEIHRIYAAFRGLVRDGTGLEAIDGADVDLGSWVPSLGTPVVDCDDVVLAGHSFGGCTTLSILTSSMSEYPPLPVSKVLMYDPWLEPLPTPGPTPTASFSALSTLEGAPSTESEQKKPATGRQLPQMLVINSQAFTLWNDHFTRLSGVVNAWEPQGRRLLTLVGSQHASFSDFPVLPLVRTKAAGTLINVTAKLSLAFLDGPSALDAMLKRVPTRRMEEKIIGKRKDGRPKRTLVGNVGDVVVH
ncbi:platelet-activating factor acetylhydrolase, isoform II-domain-containing protein [Mycena belliarum]|uniref:1-alkyl-2-acetylglycerophosphocholine esterase n=1 Tax=Mycena belliarum TaxID=1033014 RepID=A0AAD6U9U9_9AGAR|nr:platelet-activating factor acetylhydrolase, isoform II-domain-containing protein [Mycena belliae]